MGSASQPPRPAVIDYDDEIDALWSRVSTATALAVIALSLASLLTAIAVLNYVLRLAPSQAAEPADDGDDTDMWRTQAELTHKDDTAVDMTGDNGPPSPPATAAPTAAGRQQEPAACSFNYDASKERKPPSDISDMPPSCATASSAYKLSETMPPGAKRFRVDADTNGSAQAKAAGAQLSQ